MLNDGWEANWWWFFIKCLGAWEESATTWKCWAGWFYVQHVNWWRYLCKFLHAESGFFFFFFFLSAEFLFLSVVLWCTFQYSNSSLHWVYVLLIKHSEKNVLKRMVERKTWILEDLIYKFARKKNVSHGQIMLWWGYAEWCVQFLLYFIYHYCIVVREWLTFQS